MSTCSFLLSVLAGVVSGIIVEIIVIFIHKWFDCKKK